MWISSRPVFPSLHRDEFESVSRVAKAVKNARVMRPGAGLDKDIDRAAAALDARHPVLHTFIATSEIHMERQSA